jgi:hypothetical protein
MATTQAAKEMRRYMKMNKIEAITILIEDLEETVVNTFEDIKKNEDESVKIIKTKKMLG